jgi:starch phosphorylase
MNEGHSVSLNFYLYAKYKSLAEVKKKVVFTTHTPEMAGNEAHSYSLLKELSFFYHLQEHEVKSLLGLEGDYFNYTLAALQFSRKANGVSKLHGDVARRMWGNSPGACQITSITNVQNKMYWVDPVMDEVIAAGDNEGIVNRKKAIKHELFKMVADQCGKLFDENVLTIVWARRFAGYKRADLMMQEWGRFISLVENTNFPVQILGGETLP